MPGISAPPRRRAGARGRDRRARVPCSRRRLVLAVPPVTRGRGTRHGVRPAHATGCPACRRVARAARGAGVPRLSATASRSAGAIVAAGAHTERPTSTPDAPAPQATATWRSNVTSSTPPESSTHGSRCGVQLRARVRPRGCVIHGRVVRELGLEDVAADRGESARGLDDASSSRLAGQPSAGGGVEPQGSTNSGRSAARQAAATSATNRSWSAAFAASWW